MQTKLKQTIFLFFFIITPSVVFSQLNDYKVRKCFGYQKDSCERSNNMFYKVHQESRSALFVKGQTSKTPFTIYNGRDYRVSLCWSPVLGSHLEMKIIDQETGDVLYNNADDEFASEFEFTVTMTRDIYIEIKIPGESALINAKQSNEDLVLVQKDVDMGCVGVLVEHMITPTKGF